MSKRCLTVVKEEFFSLNTKGGYFGKSVYKDKGHNSRYCFKEICINSLPEGSCEMLMSKLNIIRFVEDFFKNA